MAKTGENSTNFMKKQIYIKSKKISISPIIKDLFDNINTICVTGQMASGKNFVCSQLEKMGWISVDADCLVHKAIDNSTEEIVQTFRPYTKTAKLQILTKDNKIDRKALGKLLFENPNLLKKQEELIYPKVIQMTEDFVLQNKKAIINATVLYKIPHLLQRCQTIIYVKAPLITRILRAKKRDKLPLKQIIARFHSQKNLFNEYKKSGIKIIIIKN